MSGTFLFPRETDNPWATGVTVRFAFTATAALCRGIAGESAK